jgi:RimJ/RimL family protein N-acetyltransferase
MSGEPGVEAWLPLPLVTARLVVRRFRPAGDLAAFQAYRHDPLVARYQGWTAAPEAEALAFLTEQSVRRRPRRGHWVQLAVATREEDGLAGDLAVRWPARGSDVAEIGYTIARPWQGRGFATEAVGALCAALLRHPGVRRVVAITDTRNAASAALLRRLGFRLESTQPATFRGEACEEHRFVLALQAEA